MLVLKKVSRVYETKNKIKTKALADVSLQFGDCGFVFLVGESGSGKSTLLNMIGGLDRPDQGEVIVCDKSMKYFKEKDYDYYRNTYVGFIFQEFYLLEEYNVYDNIRLALELQKEVPTQEELDFLLSRVGLAGLGLRHINELSGGQKQRVAIARALIKKPMMILADEPTGALDSKTSQQIFMLLKEISKNTLVIVVSHDITAAKLYGDRIITLQDGKVVSDRSQQIVGTTQQAFVVQPSKLPLKASFHLALSNLKQKKIRLGLTIILIICSLVFFGMSLCFSHLNLTVAHANTLSSEKIDTFYITKNERQYDGQYYAEGNKLSFTSSEIEKVNQKLSKKALLAHEVYDDNRLAGFSLSYQQKKKIPAYYMHLVPAYYVVETDQFASLLAGRSPKSLEEVVIGRYLADLMMFYGVQVYQERSPDVSESSLYFPKSYEELVTSEKDLAFGTTKVRVVGILKQDVSKFYKEPYLSSTYQELSFDKQHQQVLSQLANFFPYEFVYAKEGFIEHLATKENDTVMGLGTKDTLQKLTYQGKKYSFMSSLQYLHQPISIYDGHSMVTISQLEKGQLVINENFLTQIDTTFTKRLTDYVKQQQQKQQLLLQQGGEAVLSYQFQSEEELKEDFIKNYLQEQKLIGATVSFQIPKDSTQDQVYQNLRDLRIVGYTDSLFADCLYFSKADLKDLVLPKSNTRILIYQEKNASHYQEVLTAYPINHSQYTLETPYSASLNGLESNVHYFSKIAFYVSIVFMLFAVLLLTNFISSSVSSSKRQIGILRAIGTKKYDVFKVFLQEGLVIGLVSLLFAVILCFGLCYYGNNILQTEFFFVVRPFIFYPYLIGYLLIFVLVVVFLSCLVPVFKISKMKPIDAILNK